MPEGLPSTDASSFDEVNERKATYTVNYWKRYFELAMRELLKTQDPTYPGYFSTRQGEMLLHLASLLPPKSTIVEIGSLMGKSTRWLAVGAMLSGSRLICIDPFKGLGKEDEVGHWADMTRDDTLPVFQTMLNQSLLHDQEIWANIKIVREESAVAARKWQYGKIDMLFIDGLHTRAVQDFEDFLPHCNDWVMIVQDDVSPMATKQYGINGPLGLHEMLLREGWYPYAQAELDVAYTTNREWWDTHRERVVDSHRGIAQWAFWETRFNSLGPVPSRDCLGPSTAFHAGTDGQKGAEA